VGSASAILELYAQARARFPNANVSSGSLDDVAESLLRPDVRRLLPVLELEVGDTWSYGIQSDPRKVANVRAAIRHRAAYEAVGSAATHTATALHLPPTGLDTPFTWWSNFSRCLLKGFEHTWGLRYDMCYGGGFDQELSIDKSDSSIFGTKDDPDNPFPYYDIPGGMANASGYANSAFHRAR
jgi:hypothetical protein